jgi:hypothetical protein
VVSTQQGTDMHFFFFFFFLNRNAPIGITTQQRGLFN